jgi:ABC-type antimicrobial peptide transport system permease subunit
MLGLLLRGALWQLSVDLAIGVLAALAGVVLTACALVAGFVPAQRAASIDPNRALLVEQALTHG